MTAPTPDPTPTPAAPFDQPWWRRLTSLEPAVVAGVVTAVVGVGALVGIDLSDLGERITAAWLLILPALALVQAWWTRSRVTPTARTAAVVDRAGHTLAGPASAEPTGAPVVIDAPTPPTA